MWSLYCLPDQVGAVSSILARTAEALVYVNLPGKH